MTFNSDEIIKITILADRRRSMTSTLRLCLGIHAHWTWAIIFAFYAGVRTWIARLATSDFVRRPNSAMCGAAACARNAS